MRCSGDRWAGRRVRIGSKYRPGIGNHGRVAESEIDAVEGVFFAGADEIHVVHRERLLGAVGGCDVEYAIGDPVVERTIAGTVAEIHNDNGTRRVAVRTYVAARRGVAGGFDVAARLSVLHIGAGTRAAVGVVGITFVARIIRVRSPPGPEAIGVGEEWVARKTGVKEKGITRKGALVGDERGVDVSSSAGEWTRAARGALIGDVGTPPGERGGGHVGCAGEMGAAAVSHGSAALGESGRCRGKQEKNEERDDGLRMRENRPA